MTTLGQKFTLHQDIYKGWWKGLAKPIVARCPMCEIEHEVEIWWVGRGQPRLYCHACKLMMARNDADRNGVEVYRDCYKRLF